MYKYISYSIPSIGKFKISILSEPTSSHSLASLELLNEYFREKEIEYVCEKFKLKLKKKDLELSSYVKMKILRASFDKKFLQKRLKRNKKLNCFYCKKNIRIVKRGEKFNKNECATVDHIITLSEGCDWFDEKNLNPSCYKCNNDRNNIPYNDWLEIVKNKKNDR